MLNYKIPQNPLTNVRREEYSQVNILANHINKEKYLHDKLNEEKLLRKSIIKAMNKENIEIKEKTKHVIEIFKEKLSNAELCIKQYNKKMKLLEKKLNEKHAIKLEKIEPIAVEQLNVPDMKFESPNVLTTTNNYINSNPSTECHETWCTPQSLSSGNLTPIHTPHHTTVKKSTAKKNLYFNNIDNENSDQKLDVRLDTILHHHHHQSPTIHTPLVNQKQSLDEIATLSVAKHKIIELTQLIKKLKSNEISDHNNSNAINHHSTSSSSSQHPPPAQYDNYNMQGQASTLPARMYRPSETWNGNSNTTDQLHRYSSNNAQAPLAPRPSSAGARPMSATTRTQHAGQNEIMRFKIKIPAAEQPTRSGLRLSLPTLHNMNNQSVNSAEATQSILKQNAPYEGYG